jgi:hypothetical protein
MIVNEIAKFWNPPEILLVAELGEPFLVALLYSRCGCQRALPLVRHQVPIAT